MADRWLVTAFALMTLAACHRGVARPVPVVCPAAPLPKTAAGAPTRVRIDNPPPASLFDGPYTVVIDDQIVAVVRTHGDTIDLASASRNLDPATIKSIEVLRVPKSTQQYPKAVGDVLRITRCY